MGEICHGGFTSVDITKGDRLKEWMKKQCPINCSPQITLSPGLKNLRMKYERKEFLDHFRSSQKSAMAYK